jgi:excisionase family DNA binding protein
MADPVTIDPPRFLGSKQVAERLGYSPRTIRRMVTLGLLNPHRLRGRGHFRFAENEVDALVARLRRSGS